jgi:hypothetical protein
MRTELFSQSQNHQRSQRRVFFNRFMLGVLKQVVRKIKRSLSSHLTNGQDTVLGALKQYSNKTISVGFISLGLRARESMGRAWSAGR